MVSTLKLVTSLVLSTILQHAVSFHALEYSTKPSKSLCVFASIPVLASRRGTHADMPYISWSLEPDMKVQCAARHMRM
ncbi:TPA: hypothetical protein ACH3X1_004374 [Trebouxia sp. C0004]